MSSLGHQCAGIPDVACYSDVTSGTPGTPYAAITFSDIPSTSAGSKLWLLEYDINTPGSSNLIQLDDRWAIIPRVEAKSQYDAANGDSKWVVVASVEQPTINGGGTPFQVWGYDDLNLPGMFHLSSNHGHDTLYVLSPAVAAGISPSYSGDIGNSQYTYGYYPQDYNNVGMYPYIYSDAFPNAADYQVNTVTPGVIYPWDVNRAYAVSNSSNSGFEILSAFYDQGDIVYKLSGNTLAYKLAGNQNGESVAAEDGIRLFPNPATNELNVIGAEGARYEIRDVTGKVLLSGVQQGASVSKIETLPSGLYIYRVSPENKNTQIFRFIKQ